MSFCVWISWPRRGLKESIFCWTHKFSATHSMSDKCHFLQPLSFTVFCATQFKTKMTAWMQNHCAHTCQHWYPSENGPFKWNTCTHFGLHASGARGQLCAPAVQRNWATWWHRGLPGRRRVQLQATLSVTAAPSSQIAEDGQGTLNMLTSGGRFKHMGHLSPATALGGLPHSYFTGTQKERGTWKVSHRKPHYLSWWSRDSSPDFLTPTEAECDNPSFPYHLLNINLIFPTSVWISECQTD